MSVSPGRRFGINVFSNIAVYVINIGIGLWLTPYLITHLGVASYGLVPLATTVTSYLSIFTLALNGAVGRYISIELKQKKYKDANITFNTSLLISSIIFLGGIPFIAGIVWAIPDIFNIPSGNESGARLLFASVMFSFLVSSVESCFSISSWALLRFDLRNIVVTIGQFLRVGLVILLFKISSPSIEHVGLGVLASAIFGLFGNIALWKYLTPDLHINFRLFDRFRVKKLFNMGGWMTVNQIGSLLFLNIDLIVANLVLGAKSAGEYGSVLLFSTMLRGLAGTVANILTPMALEKFAWNDLKGMENLISKSVKTIGIALALPIGLICGFSTPLLRLWLGEEFTSLSVLLILLVSHLSVNLAVLPFFGIQVTLNNIKVPGLVTLISGIVNLVLALIFTLVLKMNVSGIALAGAVTLTMKNAIFTPVYSAYIQKLPWHFFIPNLIPGIVCAVSIYLISYGISIIWNINNWIELIAFCGIETGVYFFFFYYFFLSNNKYTNFLKVLDTK